MEGIRIAILDQNDNVLCFLDNETGGAVHYYDDELHEYLKGAASTFSFTSLADTEVSNALIVGNKVAFVYNGRDYYLNIMRVERDETEVLIEAYSLSFELLNEQVEEYKSPGAMSFSQYLGTIDPEKTLIIGLNEVSDKRISYEWTGESTVLARLFSLATVFSAEIEFVTNLNKDYSLNNITLNVYKEHSDDYQGIGKNQTGYTLRYGVDISGIRKKSDVTDLYTYIRLTGKDGLSIAELDKTEYDNKGNIEYRSPKGDPGIRAVQARDRFPSNLMNKNDRYIARYATYETDNVNVLYGQALGMLKKNCIPNVEYEVEGYVDTEIGDTVSIEDDEYKPTLYLEARVSEQVRSFTNPSRNKTVFSNFQEKQSQISAELLAQMQVMINSNKTYTYSIISDKGIVFKNSVGETTLEASVMDGGKDITNSLTIVWYSNGLRLSSGKTIVVKANTVLEKSVLKFEAYGTDGKIRGFYEVTITNVDDGKGVQTIDVEYCQSTSSTTPPSGPWFTTAPTWENGKYIWTRTLTKYTNGSNITTTPVCVTGEQGGAGVSATAIQEQYYLSTASTTQSGGTWTETCPEWVKEKYIWTRSKCSWSNGTATYTAPVLAQGLNTANSAANTAKDTAKDAQDTADVAQEIANAATLKVTDLKADVAKIDTAMIGKADIDLANIKAGCITTAMIGTGVIGTSQIADASITEGKIVSLSANKITAGRLDAAQIEVVNLNAANITVGTINGVQIAPGAITSDKLGQQVNDLINGAVSGAQQAQTTADGKNKIYYQNTQPGLVGNKKGDTWFDTANGYRTYIWNGTAWSLSPFGSAAIADDAVTLAKVGADLQSFMDGINTKATTAQTSADGKNTVFYQGTTPSTVGRKVGDTWFNSADGNRVYTWNGNTWAAAPFGTNALGNLSVTNALIANGAIDNAKIANLDAGKITAGVLAAARIGAGSITADKLASKSITVGQINDVAIKAINDQINIGSRNLLRISGTPVTNTAYLVQTYAVVGLKPNTVYTVVMNGYTSVSTKYLGVWFNAGSASGFPFPVTTTAKTQVIKVTSPPTLTVQYISIYQPPSSITGSGTINWIAMYEGDIKPPMDWTPAPEDDTAAIATNSIANWCYNNNLTYINGGRIYTGTVSADQIAANAIVAGKIAVNAVTVGTIAAGAVNVDKLAANSVNASKIVAGSITAGQLAASTITGDKIAAGTISAGLLAANSVTADKIVTDAVTTAKIAAKAVTANEIAVGTITAAQIAANAITATQLSAGAVTAAKIAAGQITADKIAAGAITADKFYGTSITSKNYVANSAGTKIDLSNGIIDTKNFKVDSAGNVAMTGTLTMRGTQTLKICNNSAVEIGSLKYESIVWGGKTFDSAKLYGKTNVDLAVGSTANNVECQVRLMAGSGAPVSCGQRVNGQNWAVLSGTGGVIGVDPLNSPPVYATGCTKTIDFIVASGFSKLSGTLNNIVYNSIGRFCQLSFALNGNVNSETHTLVLTVPAGYRPPQGIYSAGVGGIYGWFQIWLTPTGELKVWRQGAMTSMRGTVFYYL